MSVFQGTQHWHATERCFSCSKCSKQLLGKRYTLKETRLFCAFNCVSPQRSSDSIGRSEGPSPPCSSGPPSSPSVISMSPARLVRQAVRSSRRSPDLALKSPSKVRFNFAVIDDRPEPPLRNPPPPPAASGPSESIYETVALPSSSAGSPQLKGSQRTGRKEFRSRRQHRKLNDGECSSSDDESLPRSSRRSRSVDGRRPRALGQITSRSQGKETLLETAFGLHSKSSHNLPNAKKNFYARSPKRPSKPSDSSSSSDSDSDDAYLSHYLASSLPRCESSRVSRRSFSEGFIV